MSRFDRRANFKRESKNVNSVAAAFLIPGYLAAFKVIASKICGPPTGMGKIGIGSGMHKITLIHF